MFCAKCGAVLDDNAKKCDQCGAPVRIRPNQTGSRNKRGKKAGSRSGGSALSEEIKEEKYLTEEDAFMDPVFFKEAGKEVDVDAIIKIARGEEPDDRSAADAEKDPVNTESVFAEPLPDDPAFAEPLFDDSASGEPEEEEPELDMETYLAGLPLIEKLRRKFLVRHHKREEASDERRMKMHLERASRHFSEKENTGLKAAGLKTEKVRPEEIRRREEKAGAEEERPQEEKSRAEKAEPERNAQAERLQEEKGRTEKAEPERPAQDTPVQEEKAQPVKTQEEDIDATRLEEEKLLEKIEEARRQEALRLQEEAARRAEEEARAERLAAAALQKERARAAAARRQKDQQAESPAPQKREGLEVIRLHGRDKAKQAAVLEEEAAAEAALQQEADLAAEAAGHQEEQEAKGTGKAGDRPAVQPAHTGLQQEEKTRLKKILNTDPQEYDSYRRLDRREQRELTAEERRLEEVRRLRKVRSNQQDRFDKYLGKYGLTKETAVRIATLFLIVLLSVIYVLGRGSSNASPDLSNAGDGMTGIESAQEQTGGEVQTDSAQETGETQVPTGGGDFGSN